jgi:hypothetical protein
MPVVLYSLLNVDGDTELRVSATFVTLPNLPGELQEGDMMLHARVPRCMSAHVVCCLAATEAHRPSWCGQGRATIVAGSLRPGH